MKYFVAFSLSFFCLPLVAQTPKKGIDERINEAFKPISDFFSEVVFFEIGGNPFVIYLLVGSALFFTFYFGFINIRRFPLAIKIVRGKYDDIDHHESVDKPSVNVAHGDVVGTIKDESKEGEVSHFQALATAVSGTVGNGNIAGVALAIALGGPGATFWMIVCGLIGMSTKFVECTLGVKYRDVGEDGTVYGGPMYYLKKGLSDKGFKKLGQITAIIFAVCCIGGSFGGGNAAQSNQATVVLKQLMGLESTSAGAIIGLIMAALVGLIIIGGIKRIASVTERVVPLMAILYFIACVYILGVNFNFIDDAISLIVSEAFNPKAIGVGGVIGVLMVGFKRAAFSNEAGAGSASIAHAAVKTKYPASEGLVALLEPFIDTVVICTMTALVIITFNSQNKFAYGDLSKYENAVEQNDGSYSLEIDGVVYEDVSGKVLIDGSLYEGAGITSKAFEQYIPFSDLFLTIAVFLFAISTMISWSYYGIQSWKFLFGRGRRADMTYKLLFLMFIVIGSAASMDSIWAFSDAMIFAMVFPNMIGLYFLFPVVKKELTRYLTAIRTKA
ncbi:MAG: alanine/glycine:cation symporter family protein [Flavobacteriaceae bacterium]|nr:alanine/glycine:cation symporter family protein [Flavobacteriaceae bacterium]